MRPDRRNALGKTRTKTTMLAAWRSISPQTSFGDRDKGDKRIVLHSKPTFLVDWCTKNRVEDLSQIGEAALTSLPKQERKHLFPIKKSPGEANHGRNVYHQCSDSEKLQPGSMLDLRLLWGSADDFVDDLFILCPISPTHPFHGDELTGCPNRLCAKANTVPHPYKVFTVPELFFHPWNPAATLTMPRPTQPGIVSERHCFQ